MGCSWFFQVVPFFLLGCCRLVQVFSMIHIVSDSFVFVPSCLSLSQVRVVSMVQAAPCVTFVRVIFRSSQVCYVVPISSRLFWLLLVVSS